jgi:hypothetical protein
MLAARVNTSTNIEMEREKKKHKGPQVDPGQWWMGGRRGEVGVKPVFAHVWWQVLSGW